MRESFDSVISKSRPFLFSDEKEKRLFVAAEGNRFSILVHQNGTTLITIGKEYLPKIQCFFNVYGHDVFSDNAINWVKGQFTLNSKKNPIEYVYVIDNQNQLNPINCNKQPVFVSYTAIKQLHPNPFKKYPFRNPMENMVYFGVYESNTPVCLVSGYIGNTKAVELTGETLPEYRKQGYAKAVTSAITKYLLNDGYIVITKNGINNIASLRTVQSLGFTECARELKFTIK